MGKAMRRKGFTLIELLVVIAIIGILASMVFPVFARARESARKAVCLSNVKNIALAVQMYLTDNNDCFWNRSGDSEAQEYFDLGIARGNPKDNCNRAYQANPFLRVPVRLDEYIKNRDVWDCPSAKLESTASFILASYGYWLDTYRNNEGAWGTGTEAGGPCYVAWPPGWGGTVTDSIAQSTHAMDANNQSDNGTESNKVFRASIGVNGDIMYNEVKLVEIQDTVRYLVVGDTGVFMEIGNINQVAYPDLYGNPCYCPDSGTFCAIECADWENCPWSAGCSITAANVDQWFADPSYRRRYSRHLGGSNLGFADGHAAWWPSERIIFGAYDGTGRGACARPGEEEILGACACWAGP